MVITTHDDNIDGGFCAHFCDAIFFVEIFFSRCFLCFFFVVFSYQFFEVVEHHAIQLVVGTWCIKRGTHS